MSAVVIQTSEGVRFTLPLAGPVSRFLGWVIDEMVILAACGFAAKGISALPFISGSLGIGLTILAYFAIWTGYGILLEWLWSGQTLGKRALGTRVVDGTGRKLEFPQIALRNLLRFLDALPGFYLVGGAAMLLNGRYQRLGDLVANTIVLRRRRSTLPDFQFGAAAEKYNSLLEMPHLAARLRQLTPPELGVVAYEVLLRRDELQAAARVEIFRELADEFKRLVRFPDAVSDSLTDERYVRNAVRLLSERKIGSVRGARVAS